LPIMGAPAYSYGHDSVLILYLALVTGLAALTLYYYGLQRTPAVLSSLAELTYPAVAVIAGIYAYDQHLRWTQRIGVALILGAENADVRAGLEVARSAGADRPHQHRRRALGAEGRGDGRPPRERRRRRVPGPLDARVRAGRTPAVAARCLGGIERREHGADPE